MYKNILTIILTISLIVPCFAIASEVQESTISVESTVNSDIEPDTVKIKFYVENSGTNLADIKNKNDKIVNAAINEIKKKLKANETIKTTAFRVNNIYSYKDKIRIFQKYEVVNGFEVKLKDLSKTSEIIKIAMDSGVKRVDNLNFYIEDGQKTCNDLMIDATKTAKERASILAGAAGEQLGKAKNINPYCSLNSNYVQRQFYTNSFMAKSATDGAGEESAVESIEPGTINVRAGVNMTYYLK